MNTVISGEQSQAILLAQTERVNIELMPGAKFNCVMLLLSNGAHECTVNLKQAAGSELVLTRVILGSGELTYREVHENTGATSAIKNRICYLNENAVLKEHVTTTHSATGGVCEQNYAGLVKDKAQIFSTARIHVNEGAPQTDSSLHFEHLMLNKGTRVLTKPELEIYTDDVKCAHGASLAELDEKAIYFLQARGLSSELARTLLMTGLVQKHLEYIDDASVMQTITCKLAELGVNLS